MGKINFQNKEYQLFFSNNLVPLIALNYADEIFFDHFERLCGKRYRILSIIRNGWQEKYGSSDDIIELGKQFEKKISDHAWIHGILNEYEEKATVLRNTLDTLSSRNYGKSGDAELINDLRSIRKISAPLDAMSNMLHLFSSLVGDQFMPRLKSYSSDVEVINKNYIFYTQPIKESKFAKIKIRKLNKQLNLSAEDQNFSDILRAGAYIKDDVSSLLELRSKTMGTLFKELSMRLGLKGDDIFYLQIPEIERFLANKAAVGEIVRARRLVTTLYYPDANLVVYDGKVAEEFLTAGGFKKKVDPSPGHVLRGQIASPGKASGRVIVAKSSDEAVRIMRVGDILVAPYTAVEYLPAMKKAAAIVTETGGVTSHAAIVSRELNIPCVIGVDNVITVLKDGDLVEVDADRGIVRILERNSGK